MTSFLRIALGAFVTSLFFLLAACSSQAGKPHVPPRAVQVQPPSDSQPASSTTRKVTVYADLPGAVLVINGVPAGECPLEFFVKTNPSGFLREAVSVRVRFLAKTSTDESSSVECVLERSDKVPTVLRFTRDGVKREF